MIQRLTVTLRYAGQILDTETDSDVMQDRLLIQRFTVTLYGTYY